MDEVSENEERPVRPAFAPRWISTRAANTLRYSLMNLFILIGIGAIAYGGLISWTGLLLSFVLVGFVDELFGDAGAKEDMPPVWYMQAMLYLTLPLLVFGTLVVFNVSSATGFAPLDAMFRALGFDPVAARARSHGYWAWQGAFVSLAMYYGAAGVNVAHELVHRLDRPFDVLVGKWLLAFTWDTGFAIEHVYGHHRNVGTERDPATAKRGEYIFFFAVRSTIGQWLAARRLEQERLRRKGLPNTLITNRFWRGQLMTLVVLLFYMAFLGPVWGLLMCAYTGSIGKLYLEIVNYVEHYGLVRIPGTPVEPRHSWDSYRRVSTGLFYNLQLHAHHHTVATRRYWELQHSDGRAPVMPMGYMAMIFLSFVPYFWTPYINRLLADWDDRLASPAEREYLAGKGLLLGSKRPEPAPAAPTP